jgi:autotransporter strand-loop-strand O-heptosyltransferase
MERLQVTDAAPLGSSVTPTETVGPAPEKPPETGAAPLTASSEPTAPETPPEPVPIPTEVIAGSAPATGSGAAKPAYPPAPAEPTQHGPDGIRFDFNDGCRVVVPEADKPWRVRLKDLDTDNTIYETSANFRAGRVSSTKRYFVRFRVEIWQDDEQLLAHDYEARDRDVAVLFPVGTLGDTMGWFPYAVKFQEKHGCRLTCAMAAPLIPLFADAYPDISFVTHDEFRPERYYATYRLGLFFDDKDCVFQPCDFRLVGLHRTAGYILGVDPTETPPHLAIPDRDERPIAEPYVCIAVQSSTQAKYWNNPFGWHEIVTFLKEAGYRVICIDQRPVHGTGLVWNHIPHGAEDETGNRPLVERARWLRHAEFFIGLSSGLAWLAWAAGTPVVLISGFTHPLNEFHTPFRVINYHACNSCWNDPQHRFDHHDFLWCPRHANTQRQFECTRLITTGQVKAVLQRIPGFGESARTKKRAVRAV